MKLLITGGAGFIGANFVSELIRAGGYEIVVLDDLSAGQAYPPPLPQTKFVQGDFSDRNCLAACLRGVEAVVHLAAVTGVIDSINDPRFCFDVNIAGSFQLLELARTAGVRRVINASTGGALLGDVTPPISESMAPSPMSPYGASKLAVEGLCSAYAGSYGIACASLRFSNVYGPQSSHKNSVVAAFIKQVLREEPLVVYGDGTQQRDYLFVGDLVRGIRAVIEQKVTGTYQLGFGKPTSLLNLIARLEAVVGRKLETRFMPRRRGEVHATWCDISKAREAFGFSAPTALDQGLRATWDWFVANRDTWTRQTMVSSAE
jgi:UDP-glucose 4-epimerase